MSAKFRGFKFCDVKNRLILKNSKVLNFVELFCSFSHSWSKHFEPPLLFVISMNLYGFCDQGCNPQIKQLAIAIYYNQDSQVSRRLYVMNE